MKRVLPGIFALVVLTSPLSAQEEDGGSMMERGAQEFLEGLLEEMEPAWSGMQEFMQQMGPAMIELMEQVKDWSAYEAPEILENGDIIIRRKPAPEETPDPLKTPDPLPQIEL